MSVTTEPPLLLETFNIASYHKKETLPDLLTKTSIETNSTNLGDLLLYCQRITKFLQKNKIYGSPYQIGVGAFENLFSVLASYYKMPNLTTEQKLELVKVEQSIHWITDMVSSQDISFYLCLIEESCEGEGLCELIMLLYRKLHFTFNESHEKLMHFLTPFIEFVSNIGFEYHKILELNLGTMINEALGKLKNEAAKLGIIHSEIGAESFGDLRLLELKEKILQLDVTKKDKDYFYCLGLWSFTTNLLHLAQERNYAFLRICVSISFYFDYINGAGDDNKVLTKLGVSSLQDGAKCYEGLLATLPRLETEKLQVRTSVFETMNCVLSILCKKKISNVEGADDIQKLLVIPFGEVCANKEFLRALTGSSFGSFSSLFEQLLWALLDITNQLFDGFVSTFRENKLHDLMALRILEVKLPFKNCAPIIAEKYYSTVEKLRKYTDSINTNILLGCNFFKTSSLKDVLAHNYNENTLIQLRYIFEALKDLPNKDKSQLQILLKSVFESFLEKVQGKEIQIEKLKEIGIFLLRVLTVRGLDLEKQRDQFFAVYLEFLVKKCKLNLWDLILLQESLWSNFVLIENFDGFCESRLMLVFLKYYQDQVGNVKRELKKPLILNKIKESPAFRKVLWNFLSSSILEFDEDPAKLGKFVYFTLQWTDCLVMYFEPEKDQDCHAKLTQIHTKLIEIFLSPCFMVYVKPPEKKIINTFYSLILGSSQQSKWRATGALCHLIELLLDLDLRNFVTSPEGAKELLQMIENSSEDDDYLLNYKEISKPALGVYSMMVGLAKLSSIFENADICPYSQCDRDAIIHQYSITLDILKDFIPKVCSLNVNACTRAKVAQFFKNFGQGINAIIKPFNRMIPSHKMTIEFTLDLVIGALKNKTPLAIFLAVFDGLKNSLSEALLKKTLTVILYADNVFASLFERVDQVVKEACCLDSPNEKENLRKRENLFGDIDYIANFLCTLQIHLDLKLDKAKIQVFVGDYLKKPFEKLVENLFEVMTERIRKLSFWKVTAINSASLNRALQYIITIFQNCFVIVKTSTESRIIEETRALKRPDMKILRHEREKFYANNGAEALSKTQYLFVRESSRPHNLENKIETKEESVKLDQSLNNSKEIYEKSLQNTIQKTQVSLEKLKKKYAILDQGFCTSLGPFLLLFGDQHCTKLETQGIDTIRRNSSETLMRVLKKFTLPFAEESPKSNIESIKDIDSLLEEEINQALKIEVVLNPVCNKINMLHGFLKTLRELLKKSTHELSITKSSVFCLHCSCKVLLTEFLNQDFQNLEFAEGGLVRRKDFENSTQSVIDNMTCLLVTFYLCLLKKGEKSSDEALAILKWVELVFTLYQHSEPTWGSIFNQSILLANLMNLMQIALCINQACSINFLLRETSLLQAFLNSKRYTSWSSKFLTLLTFVFSSLLQNSISDEVVVIDQEMKRMVGVAGCKLNNLENEPFVQKTLEKSPEALMFVLNKNFNVTFADKNIENKDLYISLDLKKQPRTPTLQIQEILNGLNEDAKILVDMLTQAVVDNHTYNMSIVANEGQIGYKETTNILTVVSALASKYPHLAIYLGFKRKDYKKGLENLTFLECLFRLDYFKIHFQDLITMIKILCSPLGVPFVSDKGSLLLDVSHIFMHQVLEFLAMKLIEETRKLEKDFQPSVQESYLSLHSIVISFTFLWTEMEANVSNEIFESLFREKFLNLLKDILSAWRFIAEKFYPILKNCGSLDSIMTKLLSYYSNSRLKLCSVDANSIANNKNENYHEYLALDSESWTLDTILHGIESIPIKEMINEENATAAPHNFWESWELENELIFPVVAGTRVCKDQTISENSTQRLQAFEGLSSGKSNNDSIKNLGNYLKKMSICAETSSKVQKDFCVPLSFKYNLILEEAKTNEAVASKSVDKNIQSLSDLIKNPILNSNIDICQKKNDQQPFEMKLTKEADDEEEEKVDKVLMIKYFFHSRLNDISTLKFLENQMMVQLKFVSEQVLLTLARSATKNKNPEFQKNVTTEEVQNYSKSLQDFDKNLLLCLLINFDILNNFEYPSNFKEIKEEYTWMKTNFTEYLKELNNMRKSPVTNEEPQESNNLIPSPNLSNDIHFQSPQSSPQIILPNTNFKTPSEKDIKLIAQLYLVDDALVESLLSFFFIEYEKGFASSNAPMLQMLQELCKVPAFEAKILDFCLIFIHCPAALIQGYAVQKSCFSNHISKFEARKGHGFRNIVASNMFDFLKSHLKVNENLFYLPRKVLASQRLAPLQTSFLEKDYLQKTCNSVSVLDLLVASLNTYQSSDEKQSKELLESIILYFFSTERAFNIVNVLHKSVPSLMQYKVLTTNSCQKLLQNMNPDTILKNAPSIILHDIDSVLLQIEKKIQELETLFEVTNAILYRKIKEDENEVVNMLDIENLCQKQVVIKNLEELVSFISGSLASWMLNQKKIVQAESTQLYQDVLKTLQKRLFSQKHVNEFMINLFELATYLLHKNLSQSNKTISLATSILKICVHFYAIFHVNELGDRKAQSKESSTNLSEVILSLPKEASNEIPDPIHSFKKIKKSGEINYQRLLADLCMKHPDTLFKAFSEDSGKKRFQKEVSLIQEKVLWVLDLTTKKRLLATMMKNYYDEAGHGNSNRQIEINRKDLLNSSIRHFSNQPLSTIRQKVQVSFLNEFGMDGGGLRREWYAILAAELFDPKKGLFKLSKDNVTLQPSSIASMVPSHLKFFEFAGIIIAKAMAEDCVVDANLSKPFIKHLMRKDISLYDLADIDPDFEKSLRWILNNPVEGLEQQFTYEVEFFESTFTEELVSSGHETMVTEANKELFVQKVCEARVRDEISEELAAFMRGFYLIIPADFLQLFSVQELQALIGGVRTIDVQDMEKFASYVGFDKDCEQIKWFWEILHEFSQEELGAFWFFTSGSPKPAYGGFKEKPLKIYKNSCTPDRLPIARTCSTTIEFPVYGSKQQMKQKLLCSINEGQRSFMFS